MSVNSFRDDEEQKVELKKVTITRLFRYLFHYKPQIVLVIFIMLIITAIALINPLIIERAINVNVAAKDWRGLLILGGIAGLLYLIHTLLVKVRMYVMAKISNKVLVTIREELYRHIQKLDFGFFDSRPTGKILARIVGDVNSLREMLSDAVTTLIPDMITLIAVVAIMIAKSPWLALGALSTLPLLMVGMWIIQSGAHKRWQKHRRKSSNLNAFVHEDLSGIKVVQSLGAQAESREDFDFLTLEHKDSFVDACRWSDYFGPLTDSLWAVGNFALYVIAIMIVGVENIEIGTIIAFATYMSMFWSPIRNLSNFYNKLVTNMAGAERIFEILDTDPVLYDKNAAIELPEIEGRVRFENVSFAYADDPDTIVLDNVSFEVKQGETIALVGPTGAGKTTIINLISRFYDIGSGDIFIDDYNIQDITINSLRRQMGVMTQENFIFSGTVRDNIRYGKLDATDEEIEQAAKATGAHEFIMKLEKGYDTELSEHGTSLSIGQRQLLAFARTMVSMPRILILDEATSSIDTKTELAVQAGIKAVLEGRTSFVVAHRLSTIKSADRIFVINHGRIIEAGSHAELMEKRGEYFELYQAQFKSLRTGKQAG